MVLMAMDAEWHFLTRAVVVSFFAASSTNGLTGAIGFYGLTVLRSYGLTVLRSFGLTVLQSYGSYSSYSSYGSYASYVSYGGCHFF